MSVDLSVAEFLSAVRNESLPGGGSVTALAGGLASSLLGKVCRLTAGRDEFLAYEDQTRQVWRECTFLDQAFLDLMERDAEAYRRVVAAYGLPKETDDQRAARARELEAAWQGAVETPAEIARRCRGIVELARKLVGRSNKTTTADVGLAAHLAYAGVEAAAIIMKDNLAKVKDEAFFKEHWDLAERLLVESAGDWEEIRIEINELCACTL